MTCTRCHERPATERSYHVSADGHDYVLSDEPELCAPCKEYLALMWPTHGEEEEEGRLSAMLELANTISVCQEETLEDEQMESAWREDEQMSGLIPMGGSNYGDRHTAASE